MALVIEIDHRNDIYHQDGSTQITLTPRLQQAHIQNDASTKFLRLPVSYGAILMLYAFDSVYLHGLCRLDNRHPQGDQLYRHVLTKHVYPAGFVKADRVFELLILLPLVRRIIGFVVDPGRA